MAPKTIVLIPREDEEPCDGDDGGDDEGRRTFMPAWPIWLGFLLLFLILAFAFCTGNHHHHKPVPVPVRSTTTTTVTIPTTTTTIHRTTPTTLAVTE